jgi:hypothetical protein
MTPAPSAWVLLSRELDSPVTSYWCMSVWDWLICSRFAFPVWAWFGNTNQPRHLVNAPHVLRTSQHMLPLHESSSLPIREDRSAVLHTCIWLILDPPYRFQLPSLHDRRPCCPAWVERLYTCIQLIGTKQGFSYTTGRKGLKSQSLTVMAIASSAVQQPSN